MSRERARALLDTCQSRGDIKRVAALVERDDALRASFLLEARARGVDLPDEAADWPAKRLVRRARGREAAARVRSNPVHRDESFVCVACEARVPPHGRTARDHCPHCLASLHVDVVPGDRAADCGGVLRATHVEQRNGAWVLHYRCGRCGAARTNRALLDGETPDRWEVIVALSGRAAAP